MVLLVKWFWLGFLWVLTVFLGLWSYTNKWFKGMINTAHDFLTGLRDHCWFIGWTALLKLKLLWEIPLFFFTYPWKYLWGNFILRRFGHGKRVASPGGNNLDFPKGRKTKGVKLFCYAYGNLLGASSGYQSDEEPDESSELHRCFYPL